MIMFHCCYGSLFLRCLFFVLLVFFVVIIYRNNCYLLLLIGFVCAIFLFLPQGVIFLGFIVRSFDFSVSKRFLVHLSKMKGFSLHSDFICNDVDFICCSYGDFARSYFCRGSICPVINSICLSDVQRVNSLFRSSERLSFTIPLCFESSYLFDSTCNVIRSSFGSDLSASFIAHLLLFVSVKYSWFYLVWFVMFSAKFASTGDSVSAVDFDSFVDSASVCLNHYDSMAVESVGVSSSVVPSCLSDFVSVSDLSVNMALDCNFESFGLSVDLGVFCCCRSLFNAPVVIDSLVGSGYFPSSFLGDAFVSSVDSVYFVFSYVSCCISIFIDCCESFFDIGDSVSDSHLFFVSQFEHFSLMFDLFHFSSCGDDSVCVFGTFDDYCKGFVECFMFDSDLGYFNG